MSETRRWEFPSTEKPTCPTCHIEVNEAQVEIEEGPGFDSGVLSFKSVDRVRNYVLLPCECRVDRISYQEDESGVLRWNLGTPVKLTPRLKKIREALGL